METQVRPDTNRAEYERLYRLYRREGYPALLNVDGKRWRFVNEGTGNPRFVLAGEVPTPLVETRSSFPSADTEPARVEVESAETFEVVPPPAEVIQPQPAVESSKVFPAPKPEAPKVRRGGRGSR